VTSTEPLRYRLAARASDARTLRPSLLVLLAALVLGGAGVTAATRAAAESPRGVVERYERAFEQVPADCDALAEVTTGAHAAELEPLCRPTGDEPDWVMGWPEGGAPVTRTRVLEETVDGDRARVELLVTASSPGVEMEARPTYLLERVDGAWRVAGTG